MGKLRSCNSGHRRIDRVSICMHRRRWWVYYRELGRPLRKAVADAAAAERVTSQINLELASSAPTLFSFRPLPLADLQRVFLDFHEHVARSSLATVSRYRATQHLVRTPPAAARRPLRDNGVRYILKTCHSMYAYAARRRHVPPYFENPFACLGGKRARIEDAKPVFVFDRAAELAFFQAASGRTFGVHFLLAKLGLRPGKLVRLFVENVDFAGGWLHVRSLPELGAHTNTRRERAVPLIDQTADVLKWLIAPPTAGPAVLRALVDPAALPLANCNSRKLAAAPSKLARPARYASP